MNVLANLTKLGNQALFFVKKNRATIELVAGASLVTIGTGLLIHDANDIALVNNEVAYDKNFIKEIDKAIADGKKTGDKTSWVEETGKTKVSYVTHSIVHNGLGYAKTAGRGVACVGAGLGLISLSHVDMTKQLQTMSAVAAANALQFAEYRKNVVADAGEEKDYQYLTGGVTKTVEVKEDGTVVETTTPINSEQKCYLNTFFIDASSNYIGVPVHDLKWLQDSLTCVNNALHARGVLTGNEIRKCFGMGPTVAGQASGAFAQNKDGSLNYISIGLESNDSATQRFLNGDEKNFLVRLKYSDGRPLETNIFADTRIHELGWEQY